MGSSYVKERRPNAVQKGGIVARYLYELVIQGVEPRVTAAQVIEMVGCSKTSAYRILEELAEWLGLYKDGVYYVMLQEA